MAKQTDEQTYTGLLNSLLRVRKIRAQVDEIECVDATIEFSRRVRAADSLAAQLERELQGCYEHSAHPEKSAEIQPGLFPPPGAAPSVDESAAAARAFLDGEGGAADGERFGEDPDARSGEEKPQAPEDEEEFNGPPPPRLPADWIKPE